MKVLEYYEASKAMAVLETDDTVSRCNPDIHFINNLKIDGLILTAKGDDCDCVSRYFCPQGGIDEDQVTGSAHCMVIPYWAENFGKTVLHAKQVSKCGGDLYCQYEDDRVYIQGDAKLYMQGKIFL